MNKLQELMYNHGERLVPYVSHDESELVRHRSSYAFFHQVIALDIKEQPADITVADLGFGTGYGCALLSSLDNSQITGVDIGAECEIFARQYYPRSNVDYITQDLVQFVPDMNAYDYVVSRGVLEHVPDGLNLIAALKYQRRVMVDVPYDEAPGNEHHLLTGIREDAFAHLGEIEIYYEDLEGAIYDVANKPPKANMIMIVISALGLPKVGSMLDFPLPAVKSNALELLSRRTLSGCHYEFDSRVEMLTAVEKAIKETEVVLDIGCGIMPMTYFRPKLHLMVEPYQEYADILSYRYRADKSVMLLRSDGLQALEALGDNSVDSIFLIDVIEHIEKDVGRKITIEAERVAREQIVLFTPLGFMPQHLEHGETDGWGLSGGDYQEHRSGWLPEDFGTEWSFYLCRQFHTQDHHGKGLQQAYGAFYAIRNFDNKEVLRPKALSDFRPKLPAEKSLEQLQVEMMLREEQHRVDTGNLEERHRNELSLANENYTNLQNTCAYFEQSVQALSAEYQSQCKLTEQLLQTATELEKQLAGNTVANQPL